MSNDNNNAVEPLILTKDLNAPIQLVFDAWTQPEHLRNWMFPQQGFSCEYIAADIKTGGTSLHKMIAPNGREMWLLTKYEEVNAPTLLVFRQYDSNKNGDILPVTHTPNWPKEMRATVKLEEAGGLTKLQFIWGPVDPTPEEAEAFDAARAQLGGGWGGSFEQLVAYLGGL